MPQTQHTARKTGGDDASKTRSDASGRDDTAAAHASKKEKLLYNLKNHVYAQQFRSIHVPGEVGIVANTGSPVDSLRISVAAAKSPANCVTLSSC